MKPILASEMALEEVSKALYRHIGPNTRRGIKDQRIHPAT